MCKYTYCVDVCATDAFREGPHFLAIELDDCIERTLGVAKYPAGAIFEECAVPQDQTHFIAVNVELTRGWRPIIEMAVAPPMPTNERRSGTHFCLLAR
jgi:ferredoxin